MRIKYDISSACARDTGGCGEAKHAIPDVFIQRGKEDAMQPVIACESGGGWPVVAGQWRWARCGDETVVVCTVTSALLGTAGMAVEDNRHSEWLQARERAPRETDAAET